LCCQGSSCTSQFLACHKLQQLVRRRMTIISNKTLFLSCFLSFMKLYYSVSSQMQSSYQEHIRSLNPLNQVGICCLWEFFENSCCSSQLQRRMHKKRKKSTNCSNRDGKQQSKEPEREREREDEGEEEEDETRKLTIDDEDMRITSQQTSRMMKQKARRGKAQYFW
jgi:hypothetical protein